MTLRETSAAVIEKSLRHDMSINTFKIKYGGMIDGVATSAYNVTNIPEGSLVVASVTVNVVATKPIVVKKATTSVTSDSWIAPILSSIYASLRTCDELVDKLIELGTRYKKTTADGLIYFIPFQDDTLLIKVIRMDPGIAINEWTEDLLIKHYGFGTLAAIARIAAEELDDLEDLEDFDNE